MPLARVIFVTVGGTFAAGALRGMLQAGIEVAEIWRTGPNVDRKTVRHLAPEWHCGVIAGRAGIRTFHPPRLRGWDGALAHIGATSADLLVTANTFAIIPASLLDHFGDRAVDFHPALLPHYRGPTPIDSMVLDGGEDAHGGMTLHRLARRIDEGPIIGQLPVPRAGRHIHAWRANLAEAARSLAVETLPRYLAGHVQVREQSGGSYANSRKADLPAELTDRGWARLVNDLRGAAELRRIERQRLRA